jgi:hypothetical protein
VQRWPDLSKLPVWAIENATRRWEGRWVRVARIVIPEGQHDVGTEENLRKAERMNFTPWRVLPEHQPLGSVNRARFEIYRAMSAFRLRQGGPPPPPSVAVPPSEVAADEMPVSST